MHVLAADGALRCHGTSKQTACTANWTGLYAQDGARPGQCHTAVWPFLVRFLFGLAVALRRCCDLYQTAHRQPVSVKVGSLSSAFRFRALIGTLSSESDSSSSSSSSSSPAISSMKCSISQALPRRGEGRARSSHSSWDYGRPDMRLTIEFRRRGRPGTAATAAPAGRRSCCRPSLHRPHCRLRARGCCFCGLSLPPLDCRRGPLQGGCLFSARLCQDTFLRLSLGLQPSLMWS